MNIRSRTVAAAIGLGLSLSPAHADLIELEPIQVGSGSASSFVQIEFFEGQTYLFEVFHVNAQTTGMDLLYTLDTELGDEFILDYQSFDFGNVITGLGFDGLFESSDNEEDKWWWYWVRDSHGSEWEFSLAGVTDRIVSDGSWDGWVFGRDDAPVTIKVIPAPPATLALACLLFVGRRRRRAG